MILSNNERSFTYFTLGSWGMKRMMKLKKNKIKMSVRGEWEAWEVREREIGTCFAIGEK